MKQIAIISKEGKHFSVKAHLAFRLYGFKFYVHRYLSWSGEFINWAWSVTEESSKSMVPVRPYDTKHVVIKKAKQFILSKGKKETIEAVNRIVKQRQHPPRNS